MEINTVSPIVKLGCLFCRLDRKSQGVEEAAVTAGLKRLDFGLEDVPGQVAEYIAYMETLEQSEYVSQFTEAVYSVFREYEPSDYVKIFAVLCAIAAADKNVHITELRELDRIADLWGIPVIEREEMIEEARARFKAG